jgi:hypothetical protein
MNNAPTAAWTLDHHTGLSMKNPIALFRFALARLHKATWRAELQ